MATDVDFFPTRLEYHLPRLQDGREIMFYDYQCCGKLDWGPVHYTMYALTTVAMTPRRWRETMGELLVFTRLLN